MSGLSERQRKFLVVFGGLVTLGVFGALCFLEWSQVERYRAQAETVGVTLEHHEKEARRIPEVEQEVAALHTSLGEQRRLLPNSQAEIRAFFARFHEWRRELGIGPIVYAEHKADIPGVWDDTREHPGPTVEGFEPHQRYVSFSGTFWQLGELLSRIEAWERLVIITELSVKAKDASRYGAIQLTVGFGLRTYLFAGTGVAADPKTGKPRVELAPIDLREPPPAALRERILGPPAPWRLAGQDDWGAGGRLTFDPKLPRNPFDPYPALTVGEDAALGLVKRLEQRLQTLQQHLENKTLTEEALLAQLQALRADAGQAPTGGPARARWDGLQSGLEALAKRLDGPRRQRAEDMAALDRLEAQLKALEATIESGDDAEAQRALAALRKASETPPKTTALRGRWDALRASVDGAATRIAARSTRAALAEAQRLAAEAKAAFGRRDFAVATAKFTQLRALASRHPAHAEMARLVEETGVSEQQARKTSSLDSLKISITGVMGSGKTQYALINRKWYKVGDTVRIDDKSLKIVAIKRPSAELRVMEVTFEHQGQRFTRKRSN